VLVGLHGQERLKGRKPGLHSRAGRLSLGASLMIAQALRRRSSHYPARSGMVPQERHGCQVNGVALAGAEAEQEAVVGDGG
jgi:hypothetical protein